MSTVPVIESADLLTAIRAELAAQKLSIEALKIRIDALDLRLAAEEEKREAEIEALREEWRNLAQAISANSTALGNATKQLLSEAADIKAEQKHQSDQLRLIGKTMELLLRAEGLEVPA